MLVNSAGKRRSGELNDEQWFWEKCGFEMVRHNDIPFTIKYAMFDTQRFDKLPPIDLNNLFKYAVPTCINKAGMVELSYATGGYRNPIECIAYIGRGRIEVRHRDPALALYRAIYKAFKELEDE